MFGCGIGFVWYSGRWGVEREGFAEEEDVAEGALVDHVEAGFVAVEEGEVGKGGGGGRGCRHGLGFVGPGATHAPVGDAHLFDHGEFDSVHYTEAVEMLVDKALEAFFGFAGEQDGLGEETVLAGVLRGSLFAFGCDRAARVTAVSTRRLDFSLGTHNVSNTISGNILAGYAGGIKGF